MLIQNEVIGTVAYMGGLHTTLEEFTWCWGQLIQFNYEYLLRPRQTIYYDRSRVSFHSLARNGLARHMQGEWILMLDTDHQFEPDILVRMLRVMEEFKCDVLTALYENKGFPHPPVIYEWDEQAHPRVIGDWPEGLRGFPIKSAGAGSLLIKRTVFDRINSELQEDPFDILGKDGEDHSFFKRCQKLGIRTFVAPHIESYHLALKPISRRDTVLDAMGLEDGPCLEGRF